MGAGDHVHGQDFYDREDYEQKGFDEGRVPDCLARVGSPMAKARRHEFQAIRRGIASVNITSLDLTVLELTVISPS